MTTLVAPTTSAANTSTKPINTFGSSVMTFSADNLAGAETVDIYYQATEAATAQLATNYDTETAIQLTATKPQVLIRGDGFYYVVKSATASACGVYAISGK